MIQRLEGLGVKEVYMSVADKRTFVENYQKEHRLSKENILFMGDDLPDLPVMEIAGLPACPVDAVNEIKAAAKYISPFPGGACCVRDVIEKVLKLNDHWQFSTEITAR